VEGRRVPRHSIGFCNHIHTGQVTYIHSLLRQRLALHVPSAKHDVGVTPLSFCCLEHSFKIFSLETSSPCVAGLKFMILLSQPPECWDYRCARWVGTLNWLWHFLWSTSANISMQNITFLLYFSSSGRVTKQMRIHTFLNSRDWEKVILSHLDSSSLQKPQKWSQLVAM
jgi:hypothetical protein